MSQHSTTAGGFQSRPKFQKVVSVAFIISIEILENIYFEVVMKYKNESSKYRKQTLSYFCLKTIGKNCQREKCHKLILQKYKNYI